MSARDITTLGGDVATGAMRRVSATGVFFGPVEWMLGPRVEPRAVRRLVRARQREVAECVESPLAFEAVLGLRDGAVVDARVEPEPDGETARCLARALRGTRAAAGDGPVSRVRFRMQVQRHVSYIQRSARGFTVTRLRTRYDADAPASDLVFRRAAPVRGGLGTPDAQGRMPTEVTAARSSTFQARYAILHRRPQRIRGCRSVAPGGWGGPPEGEAPVRAARALDAVRRRRPIRLERLIRTPVPDLGLRADAAAPPRFPRPRAARPAPGTDAAAPRTSSHPPAPRPAPGPDLGLRADAAAPPRAARRRAARSPRELRPWTASATRLPEPPVPPMPGEPRARASAPVALAERRTPGAPDHPARGA
jgi:hypothetical protein